MTVAVTGLLPLLTGIKAGIFPVPAAPRPIPGLLLVQVKRFPVPEKLIWVLRMPFVKV